MVWYGLALFMVWLGSAWIGYGMAWLCYGGANITLAYSVVHCSVLGWCGVAWCGVAYAHATLFIIDNNIIIVLYGLVWVALRWHRHTLAQHRGGGIAPSPSRFIEACRARGKSNSKCVAFRKQIKLDKCIIL